MLRSNSSTVIKESIRIGFAINHPKKRLYRTNSIAHELRNLGKRFDWFTKNSISIPLEPKNNLERKRTIFITGSLTCYKVRVDIWHYVTGGDFNYYEFIENNGRSLLYRLVALGILDNSYLPSIPPYQQALIEKL